MWKFGNVSRRARGVIAVLVALFGLGLAVATPAQAEIRCVAAAFGPRGHEIANTRSAAIGFREPGACRAALDRCNLRLRRSAHAHRPRVFCQVVRADLVHRPGLRPQVQPPRRHGPACNYRACERAYRSFRGSDCTFQPYHGPRRRCPL